MYSSDNSALSQLQELKDDVAAQTQMMTAPIAVSDAASIYRKVIPVNSAPYTVSVITKNNELVDEWESEFLPLFANKSGAIKACDVDRYWTIFYGYKLYANLNRELIGHTPRLSEEQFKFWKELFMQDIEVLHSFGPAFVDYGWKIFNLELDLLTIEERIEKVYGVRDLGDFKGYCAEANRYPKLFDLQYMAEKVFGNKTNLQGAVSKISTILGIQVGPQKEGKITRGNVVSMITAPVRKNMRQFDKKVTECNNRRVKEWGESWLPLLESDDDIIKSWMLYNDRVGVEQLIEWQKYIPKVTEESKEYFSKFLLQDVDTLHPYTVPIIDIVWRCVINDTIWRMVQRKWERLFSVFKGPEILTAPNVIDDCYKGGSIKHPYWSDNDVVQDILAKVTNFANNFIVPQ